MPKILTAKDILAQKGIAQTKFDSNAFMEQVAQFFINHTPDCSLLLFPYRFVDVCIDPKNDPCTIVTPEQLKKLSPDEINELNELDLKYNFEFDDNPFRISWINRMQGFCNETYVDETGQLAYISELNRIVECGISCSPFIRVQNKLGLLRYRFLIDKPFFKNAAGLLRIMGGYVVEPFRRGGKTYYDVSLV